MQSERLIRSARLLLSGSDVSQTGHVLAVRNGFCHQILKEKKKGLKPSAGRFVIA